MWRRKLEFCGKLAPHNVQANYKQTTWQMRLCARWNEESGRLAGA